MQCEEKVLKLNWVEKEVKTLALALRRTTERPGLRLMLSVPRRTQAPRPLGGGKRASAHFAPVMGNDRRMRLK